MGHSYLSHTDREPNLRIKCETQIEDNGTLYPVLQIGNITLFPSMDQLQTLHAVIGKYLESRKPPEPAEKWADPDAPNPWPWTKPNETQEVASGG